MCGSGTIPLEAAEIAAGLVPGATGSFAFEAMVGGARPEIEPLAPSWKGDGSSALTVTRGRCGVR
jgi:hypothetical protein